MFKVLACILALLCAAELSDDERFRVAEYRRSQLVATAKEIAGIEKEIKAAQKDRNKSRAEELKGKSLALRKRTNELKQAKDEEIFEAMQNAERALQAAQAEKEQKRQREEKLASAGPVSIAGTGIFTNQIGVAEIVVDLQNNTGRDVEAIEIAVDCFNKFGEPVQKLQGGNRVSFHFKRRIPANSTKQASSQLVFQQATAKAEVWITRVLLSDGNVWTQTKQQATDTPHGLAKARLIE